MPKSESAHPDQVTRNPKNGKLERVFVNLEAVYGSNGVAEEEQSFEELRALHRGWMGRDWRRHTSPSRLRKPLSEASGNEERSQQHLGEDPALSQLAADLQEKAAIVDETSTLSVSFSQQDENSQPNLVGGKAGKGTKPKRLKVKEIKQEPKTSEFSLTSARIYMNSDRQAFRLSRNESNERNIHYQVAALRSFPAHLSFTLQTCCTLTFSLSFSQNKFRVPHQISP